MKPWDPPEENLYPVLDDLLDDWMASFRPPFEGIRVLVSDARQSHMKQEISWLKMVFHINGWTLSRTRRRTILFSLHIYRSIFLLEKPRRPRTRLLE